jgi:hypothetical protein
VHPAADLFPPLLAEELAELAKSIEAHGMQVPIALYKGQLLDGRGRLDAAELAGLDVVPARDVVEIDPYEFVAAANIHRRHLTLEQKRDLIAKLVRAAPEKSDRQIAKLAKSNRNAVGRVRKRLKQAGTCHDRDTRIDTRGRKQPATKAKKAQGGACHSGDTRTEPVIPAPAAAPVAPVYSALAAARHVEIDAITKLTEPVGEPSAAPTRALREAIGLLGDGDTAGALCALSRIRSFLDHKGLAPADLTVCARKPTLQ